MYKGIIKAFLLIFITLFIACKKDTFSKSERIINLTVDESKIKYRPQTVEEIKLVENLSTLSDVLKKVYVKKANVIIVNAAIYSRIYTDESILIKDLIYPNQSRLKNNDRFNFAIAKHGVKFEDFSLAFWHEVRKLNNSQFETFLETLNYNHLSSVSVNSNNVGTNDSYPVSIYFPYHDNFLDNNFNLSPKVTSIVTATADADEGVGQIPVYDNLGTFIRYDYVIVNDDYAELNPTHIIGVNGVEPYDYALNMPIISRPHQQSGINRVYIGEGICKEQYDRLISFTGNGGGSEIKYCHLTGYLQPINGHVTSFQDIVSADFSRGQIRRKEWAREMSVWDDNWEVNDKEQVLAIYEDDISTTRTFNGSLKTTLDKLGVPVEGSIGFTVTVQSQDEIIRQLKISRESFFAGAFRNQGQDFTPDRTFIPLSRSDLRWPAYDVHYQYKSGANVGWTWPYDGF